MLNFLFVVRFRSAGFFRPTSRNLQSDGMTMGPEGHTIERLCHRKRSPFFILQLPIIHSVSIVVNYSWEHANLPRAFQ